MMMYFALNNYENKHKKKIPAQEKNPIKSQLHKVDLFFGIQT